MSSKPAMFRMLSYGATDVGLERKNNEDALRSEGSSGLFVVCDGMGGHASGELASKIAVDSVVEFVTQTIHQENFRWPFQSPNATTVESKVLDCAIRIANRKVFQQAQEDSRHKGMGTTIVAMLAGRDKIGAVHVGDSRVYRLREGNLVQLTSDHSLLNHYKRTRPMSEDEIRNFKGKNVIVRAVGLRETVEPETHVWDYQGGDTYLLCTDGLSDLVDDDYIKRQLAQASVSIKGATTNLIQRALAAGGKDNVTVMILKVEFAEGVTSETQEFDTLAADDSVGLEDTSPGFEASGDGGWDQETMPGLDGGIEPIGQTGPPDLDEILNAPTETNNRHLRIATDTVQIKVRRTANGSAVPMDDDTPDETPGIVTAEHAETGRFGHPIVDDPRQRAPLGRAPPEVRVRRNSQQTADTQPYKVTNEALLNEDTDRFDAVRHKDDATPEGVPVVPSDDE